MPDTDPATNDRTRGNHSPRGLANSIDEGFLSHIEICCRLPEPELRAHLKALLAGAGFILEEDSYRGGMDGQTPNLRAMRGIGHTALIAHTDVVRDFGRGGCAPTPVVRRKTIDGRARWILQDDLCETQLGGDDRLGVAIITWAALKAPGISVDLVFTTDEECGLKSADAMRPEWLSDTGLVLGVDRGNQPDAQLVTSIHGLRLCSQDTERGLLDIAATCALPRRPVEGLSTDVYALVRNGVAHEAVNMTCGYHRGHGDDEYIDLREAAETLTYVTAILKAGRP